MFHRNRKSRPAQCAVGGFVLATLWLPSWSEARAQTQLVLIAPRGIRGAVEQLLPSFERKTGQKVRAEFTSGGDVTVQVLSGDPFDLVILHPPFPQETASGNISAETVRLLASAALGMAVRKGAAVPVIDTSDALRRTLLSVATIACPDGARGATAGPIFDKIIGKLGITDQIRPKLRLVASGDAAIEMVARGEAELGLTYVSEMNQPGISVVGAVPRELAEPAPYAGVIGSHTARRAAAQALLDFLASPEAATIYTEHGMQALQ